MALKACGECRREISSQAKTCPHCGAKNKKQVGPLGVIMVFVVGFALVSIFDSAPTNREAPPDIKPSATAKASVELSESDKRGLASAIRGAGFNCPYAAHVSARGQDVRGTIVRVVCGDGELVYPDLEFKVTFRPNGMATVEPWD